MLQFSVIFLFPLVGFVNTLEPYYKFREGSCSELPIRAVKASRDFVDSLKYVSAGSRYHMHRMASQAPDYPDMREDEFYYDFCFISNTSSREPYAGGSGFGRIFDTYRVTTRPGIYVELIPTSPSQSWDTLRQVVTLTDNQNFAFLVNCWTGVNQRAWNVVSLSPNMDERTERQIEDHAESLGFKRKNFVFLRYDSCRRGGPIFLGDDHHDDHGGRESRRGDIFPVVKALRRPNLQLGSSLSHRYDSDGGGWNS